MFRETSLENQCLGIRTSMHWEGPVFFFTRQLERKFWTMDSFACMHHLFPRVHQWPLDYSDLQTNIFDRLDQLYISDKPKPWVKFKLHNQVKLVTVVYFLNLQTFAHRPTSSRICRERETFSLSRFFDPSACCLDSN